MNIDDAQSAYNGYYKLGKYTDRFGETEIDPIFNYVYENAIASISGNSITILDFGAGNGRYLQLAENLAENEKLSAIRIIALDPAVAGLQDYEKKLRSLGYVGKTHFRTNYEDVEKGIQPDYTAYNAGVLTKGKIELSLIHSNPALDNNESLKQLIGAVDCSISMLGPISAIKGSGNRVQAIKLLAEVTKGKVVMSVASPQFNIMSKLHIGNFNDLAEQEGFEEGDISYETGSTRKYFHSFSKAELAQHCRLAGIKSGIDIRIMNVLPISVLQSANGLVKKADHLAAMAFDFFGLSQLGNYYVASFDGLNQPKPLAARFSAKPAAAAARL